MSSTGQRQGGRRRLHHEVVELRELATRGEGPTCGLGEPFAFRASSQPRLLPQGAGLLRECRPLGEADALCLRSGMDAFCDRTPSPPACAALTSSSCRRTEPDDVLAHHAGSRSPAHSAHPVAPATAGRDPPAPERHWSQAPGWPPSIPPDGPLSSCYSAESASSIGIPLRHRRGTPPARGPRVWAQAAAKIGSRHKRRFCPPPPGVLIARRWRVPPVDAPPFGPDGDGASWQVTGPFTFLQRSPIVRQRQP